MKKTLFVIVGMLLFFSAISVKAQTVNPNFIDGRIVFKFKRSYPIAFTVQKDRTIFISEFPFLKQLASKYGIKKIEQSVVIFNDPGLMRIIIVNFDSINKIDQFVKELSGTSFPDFIDPFDFVTKDPLYKSLWKPNDPYFGVNSQGVNLSWNLDMINAEQAWEIRKGKASVKVAVVDNAVWGEHEDLKIPTNLQYNAVTRQAGNSAPPPISQNCPSSGECPASKWSHGTHCAGIVGALTNNNIGIAAIGGGVSLIGVRASTDVDPEHINQTVEGVAWAASQGAKVISLSLGGSDLNPTLDSIIQVCYQNGIIVVAAAGNNGTSSKHYPAAYSNVIAVGSVDGDRKISTFSEYGNWVDVAAPGGNNYVQGYTSSSIFSSTFSKNASYSFDGQFYDFKQGTSMACPLVAGLCGLMLSMNPDLHPDTVRNILQRTAQQITPSTKWIDSNGGIIDAYAAMLEVQKTVPQARFSANKTTIQKDSSVTFTPDESTGGRSPDTINKWEWAFEGGTPSISNTRYPTVTYNTPGIYSVKLVVTNSKTPIAQTDTIIQDYYINVEAPASDPLLIVETTSITFDTLSSSSTFVLVSNSSWEISQPDLSPWLLANPLSGIGNAVITVTSSANLLPEERNDTILFSGDGGSAQVYVTQKAATAKLRVLEQSLHFAEKAGSLNFNILSNVSWSIATPSQSWITTINPMQGTGNGKDTIKVSVTVLKNEVTSSRQDTLYITGGGMSQKIIIEQAAAAASFDVDPVSLDFNKDGESKTISIYSNVPWAIKGAPSWVTVSPTSENGDATVTVTATKNEDGKVRNAFMTISTIEDVPQSRRITLTQEKGEAGIDIPELAKSIKVYPNPAKESLHIDDKIGVIKQVSFISLLGNVLWMSNDISEITTIDIASFPKGIYMLKIITKDKREYTQKIVKQ